MLFVAFLFSCVTDSDPEPTFSSSSNSAVETTEKFVVKTIAQEEPVRKEVPVVPPLVTPKSIEKTNVVDNNVAPEIEKKVQEDTSEDPNKKSLAKAMEEARIPEAEKEEADSKEEKETKATKAKITPAPKKTVRFSKPGPKCVRTIKQVLRTKNGDVRFCYDQQKVKDPSLEGKITLQINVYKRKNSMSVKKDTLKSRGLRTCLQKKIKSWEFGDACVGTSFRKSYSLIPS